MRARGVLPPREWRGHFFGTAFAFRDRREKRRRPSRGTPRLAAFAMDPLAPSITFYDKETGKGRTTYLGACPRGTPPVVRITRPPSRVVGASRGSADALSPPAFAPRRQPHPGSALHPHPGTVVHEPRIRGETHHARVLRVLAPRGSSDEMSTLLSDRPTTSTVRLGMTKRY